MERKLLSFLVITLFTLFLGCGANKEITKQDDNSSEKTSYNGGIVSEMLEQARQAYVAALAKQELNSTAEAINNYEAALRIINNLSYYPGIEANEAYVELEKEEKEKAENAIRQRNEARAKDTRPSFELEKYAGEYDSPILGGATVSMQGGGLHIQLQAHESISGALEHWHYDTFLCKWDDPVLGESLIPFITDGQGHVVEFHVKIREDWIDPLMHVFKRKSASIR